MFIALIALVANLSLSCTCTYTYPNITHANSVSILSRSSVLPDAETHTNPIDRTVAHLLFKPSELFTRPVKEELPQSPVAYDPGNVLF